ncbi:MAG: type I pantothenate kinase [Chloroflexales bacterium]|nr:type I pantothenate kinase [Chloroflexales bacterium]
MQSNNEAFSPYTTFSRAEWSQLSSGQPLPLTEEDVNALRSLNDALSLTDVVEIYMPLARLIHMYVAATQNLYHATNGFTGNAVEKVPYVIGIAGSVAVGKSTTARILQALLAHGPDQPRVDLVTTDGFLFPNAVLEARGLMHRKGFPESYNVRRLIRFMADIKSGRPGLAAPLYSHLYYDIMPDEFQIVDRPDILIIEGLNVLQRGSRSSKRSSRIFVSDFFDFSIYVDADEKHLQEWYIARFLRLRETAFRNSASYFHRYASLSVEEAITVGRRIWQDINAINLRLNIEPTRERARLILEKGANHSLQRIRLRKL